MGKTIRREKNTSRSYPEGQENKFKIRYKCRCSYCTGVAKRRLQDRIAKREMLKELLQIKIL
jgi:hypothetical protein